LNAAKNVERVEQERSLVLRLVRISTMWAVPVLLITAFALIWFYRASTYKIFDDPLINTIQALVASVETTPGNDGVEKSLVLSSEPIDPRYQLALSGRYWLIGEMGDEGRIETILSSPSLYDATLVLPIKDAIKVKTRPGDVVRSISVGPDREPLRLAAQSVVFSAMGERPIVIIAAADRRPAARAVLQFSFIALGLMVVLACGLVIAIFMQVRMGLRPLFELQERVADVREGISAEVEGRYPREIKPLADELNSLITHNRDVVEHARTHVANLAHALKTPLAVLVNETDNAKSSRLADIVNRQADIMSKQVDHHLRRARAVARGQSIGSKTQLSPTLSSLVLTLQRIYRDKDLDIQLDIAEDQFFRGEKRDLEEMIGNLLDNACKWTKSKIHIHAIWIEGEKIIELIVDDDGPGLKDEQYDLVLKRGARLDEATPGSGFGLSIVNDLVHAYNGSLVLGKSPLGGLRVTLRIPGVPTVS
jgi:signal transduction histidine kinase